VSDPQGPGDPGSGPLGSDDLAGHADVRALLAGLGDEPLPPEVAARLDETLTGLVEERRRTGTGDAGDRGVVPLDVARQERTARRRRWVSRGLVAAAVAVVVAGIGVGLGQLSTSPGSSSMSQAGGGSADRSTSSLSPAQLAALPRVQSRHFRRDVRRVLASHTAVEGFQANDASPLNSAKAQSRGPRPTPRSTPRSTPGSTGGKAPTAASGLLAGCAAVPAIPPGARVVPVRLDGRPASLVVLERPDRTARVTAVSCLDGRVLARTTVPR
jgi:hypothetical protein